MIGDPDREANIAANIEVLQERVHDALDLADFLRVVANLSDCVELVEQKNATMAVREREQIADVARGGAPGRTTPGRPASPARRANRAAERSTAPTASCRSLAPVDEAGLRWSDIDLGQGFEIGPFFDDRFDGLADRRVEQRRGRLNIRRENHVRQSGRPSLYRQERACCASKPRQKTEPSNARMRLGESSFVRSAVVRMLVSAADCFDSPSLAKASRKRSICLRKAGDASAIAARQRACTIEK